MKYIQNTHKIAASIICGNMLHLEEDLLALNSANIDYIHFDVMDGLFVPRYGLFPEMITQIRKISSIPIEIHMMVEDPEKYIKTFIDAGLDKKNDCITIHVESTKHIDRVIRKIHSFGIKVGIALNPATSLTTLDYIISEIDLIMIMGINPGIVGHPFIPSTIKKTTDLKVKLGNNTNVLIAIDGGITMKTAPSLLKAGANILVCGSQTVFNKKDTIVNNINNLRNIYEDTFAKEK